MKRNCFVSGIVNPLTENLRPSRVASLGAALTIAAVALGVWSCGSSHDEGENMRDSVVAQPPVSADEFDVGDESFEVDNDIAMTVRSVADAINVGESIDSLDYSFKGVLTDGSGMPLFTDMDGLPGEWEVEVVSPTVVQIRNVNTGDLVSENLVGYISAAMQLDEDDTLHLVSERETANRKVSVFTFGKGTITIETEPGDDADGEPGDRMLITMRADHRPQEPVLASDTIRHAAPAAGEVDRETRAKEAHNSSYSSKRAEKGSKSFISRR